MFLFALGPCEYVVGRLKNVPDHLKTQEMCGKAVEKTHISWVISLIVLKPKKSC